MGTAGVGLAQPLPENWGKSWEEGPGIRELLRGTSAGLCKLQNLKPVLRDFPSEFPFGKLSWLPPLPQSELDSRVRGA